MLPKAAVMEGTVLGGKYRLQVKLGQGGMGSVWRAEHIQLRSPVAIKLIDPSIADNAEALGRFMREAQAAAALRSPHVVQILDYGAEQRTPYIAMELLEGESLANRLQRQGRLSGAETSLVLTHIARAMSRAHAANIIHRDLKPDNVFIVRNDDEEVCKVLDFGIAKSQFGGLDASSGASTRTGTMLGTPYYMSPEQVEGSREIDFRADIWAMGVIAYECILGYRPFLGDTLGAVMLNICTRPLPVPSLVGPVPPGFDEWFGKACARAPEQRFASAREAAQELHRVCGGQSLDANDAPFYPSQAPGLRPSTPQPGTVSNYSATVLAPDEIARGPSRWAVAAGVVVVGLIALGVGAFKFLSTPEPAASLASVAQPSAAPPPAKPTVDTAVPEPPSVAVAQPAAPEPAPLATVPAIAAPRALEVGKRRIVRGKVDAKTPNAEPAAVQPAPAAEPPKPAPKDSARAPVNLGI